MSARSVFYSKCAIFLSALFLSSHAARADAVDYALDALAASGATIGVPINAAELPVVKRLVRDIVNGKPMIQALRENAMTPVITNLPLETQTVAKCLASGTSVYDCGIRQMVAETASIGRCLATTGPDSLESCSRDELISSRLPPNAQKAARCLATSTRIALCVSDFAPGPFADTFRKLLDGASSQPTAVQDRSFKEAPTVLQNILNLVDGIDRDEWQQIVENGGAAVTRSILEAAVFPQLAPGVSNLMAPVADSAVHDRIDLVVQLAKAAKAGDAVTEAEIAVGIYLTMQIEVPCEALGQISGIESIQQSVCGTLGKIINRFGKVEGGGARAEEEAIAYTAELMKRPLDIPGEVMKLPDLGADLPGDALHFGTKDWDDFRRELAEKRDDCGTAEQFYAKRFAACYPAAAYTKMATTGRFSAFRDSLNAQCRAHFSRCYFKESLSQICDPMARTFNEQTQLLEAGLREAAASYAHNLEYFITRSGAACDAGFRDRGYQTFVAGCATALNNQFPRARDTGGALAPDSDPLGMNCRPSPSRSLAGPGVGDEACRASIQPIDFERMALRICNASAAPKRAPGGPALASANPDSFVPVPLRPAVESFAAILPGAPPAGFSPPAGVSPAAPPDFGNPGTIPGPDTNNPQQQNPIGPNNPQQNDLGPNNPQQNPAGANNPQQNTLGPNSPGGSSNSRAPVDVAAASRNSGASRGFAVTCPGGQASANGSCGGSSGGREGIQSGGREARPQAGSAPNGSFEQPRLQREASRNIPSTGPGPVGGGGGFTLNVNPNPGMPGTGMPQQHGVGSGGFIVICPPGSSNGACKVGGQDRTQPGNALPGQPGQTPPGQPGGTPLGQPGNTPPGQPGNNPLSRLGQPGNTLPGNNLPGQPGNNSLSRLGQPGNNALPGNNPGQPGNNPLSRLGQPGNNALPGNNPGQPGNNPLSSRPGQPGNTLPGSTRLGQPGGASHAALQPGKTPDQGASGLRRTNTNGPGLNRNESSRISTFRRPTNTQANQGTVKPRATFANQTNTRSHTGTGTLNSRGTNATNNSNSRGPVRTGAFNSRPSTSPANNFRLPSTRPVMR